MPQEKNLWSWGKMNKNKFNRIVVKIGTSSLMKNGSINLEMIGLLAKELSELLANGKEVILITSGAIGFGIEKMKTGFPENPTMRQAMAAIGQSRLMYEYEKAFSVYQQVIAQVLPTHHTFSNPQNFAPLKNAVEKLLKLHAIPIINENDAISTEEIFGKAFSDNDALAALVAIGFEADLLIILTDVDGIFVDNPKTQTDTPKINGVGQLLSEQINYGKKSDYGLGGIQSKIIAVKKWFQTVAALQCAWPERAQYLIQ